MMDGLQSHSEPGAVWSFRDWRRRAGHDKNLPFTTLLAQINTLHLDSIPVLAVLGPDAPAEADTRSDWQSDLRAALVLEQPHVRAVKLDCAPLENQQSFATFVSGLYHQIISQLAALNTPLSVNEIRQRTLDDLLTSIAQQLDEPLIFHLSGFDKVPVRLRNEVHEDIRKLANQKTCPGSHPISILLTGVWDFFHYGAYSRSTLRECTTIYSLSRWPFQTNTGGDEVLGPLALSRQLGADCPAWTPLLWRILTRHPELLDQPPDPADTLAWTERLFAHEHAREMLQDHARHLLHRLLQKRLPGLEIEKRMTCLLTRRTVIIDTASFESRTMTSLVMAGFARDMWGPDAKDLRFYLRNDLVQQALLGALDIRDRQDHTPDALTRLESRLRTALLQHARRFGTLTNAWSLSGGRALLSAIPSGTLRLEDIIALLEEIVTLLDNAPPDHGSILLPTPWTVIMSKEIDGPDRAVDIIPISVPLMFPTDALPHGMLWPVFMAPELAARWLALVTATDAESLARLQKIPPASLVFALGLLTAWLLTGCISPATAHLEIKKQAELQRGKVGALRYELLARDVQRATQSRESARHQSPREFLDALNATQARSRRDSDKPRAQSKQKGKKPAPAYVQASDPMRPQPGPMTTACQRLASCFPEVNTIHRLLHDAGVESRGIDFKGASLEVWYQAVQEVRKHGSACFDRFISVVMAEYPQNEELRQAMEHTLQPLRP